MSLISSEKLLQDAVASGRAIAAFNVFCAEAISAVVKAGNACGAPVIVAVNEADLAHLGANEVVALTNQKSLRSTMPVALHLDHGMSVRSIATCLRSGFTSVMFDPALLEERNRRQAVRNVVDFAHSVGISVESMVGSLRLAVAELKEGPSTEVLTDPLEASEFASCTGIDSLAVSVGTEHGAFLVGAKATVDMKLLHEISRRVTVPIVIHGGSAIDDTQLRELRRHGVGKVNIGSAIRVAYRARFLEALSDVTLDVREAAERAESAIYEVACRKIRVLSE